MTRWQDLPYLLATVARGADNGLRIIRRDDEHFNGVYHYVLEIALPDGLPSYRLHVDAASALPAKRCFAKAVRRWMTCSPISGRTPACVYHGEYNRFRTAGWPRTSRILQCGLMRRSMSCSSRRSADDRVV